MKAGKETEIYNQGYMDGYNDGENARIDPDYWTRLEHTYAGMAMQVILNSIPKGVSPNDFVEAVVDKSSELAHALVQKMKEE